MGIITIAFAGFHCERVFLSTKEMIIKDIAEPRLPVTERLAEEELSLPIGPAITSEEVAEVIRLINRFQG